MKISLKTALLSATLLVSLQPMLRADGQLCEEKKCILKKDIAEAFMHLGTHIVACYGVLGMAGLGILLDEAVKKKAEIDTYSAGALSGLAGGFYTIYNMPQWTDTHILNKDTIRSRAQNIIVFVNRLLIPYIGVFSGEMFNIRPYTAPQPIVAAASADSAQASN